MKTLKTYSATLLVALLMTMTGCAFSPFKPYEPLPVVPKEGKCWDMVRLSMGFNSGDFTCQVGSKIRKEPLLFHARLNSFYNHQLSATAPAVSMLAHCRKKAMNLFELCNETMDNFMNYYGTDPVCQIEINKQREGCATTFEDAKEQCKYECLYVKKRALEAKSNPQR